MAHRPIHHKTRYGLGPGGVVYLTVIGLVLTSAVFTQANLMFWCFGLLCGGLLVSILYAWLVMRGIRVLRLLPAHGVAGDELVIRYQLINPTWVPAFGVQVIETWGPGSRGWKRHGPVAQRPQVLLTRPRGWVLHVGPHQSAQAEAYCWPLMRGGLEFEQIILTTSFPFSIIRKTITCRQHQEVLVYPHLYRIHRRLIHALVNNEMTGQRQADRRGGSEEFYGLREYRRGDTLRHIDWKHTARRNELVSREFTQPNPPRLMVLVELFPAHAAGHNGQTPAQPLSPDEVRLAQERAISLTASLICDAYLHGYHVGVAVQGAACPVFHIHHSLPHRGRMLEALARLPLDDASPAHNELPMVDPAVIVVACDGQEHTRRSGSGMATVIFAQNIRQYVTEVGQDEVLSQYVRATSRREQIEEQKMIERNRRSRHAQANRSMR